MKWLLVLALAGGCDLFDDSFSTMNPDDSLDLCQSAPAGRQCVTLHLHGNVAAMDSVQVDSTFTLGTDEVTRRVIAHGPATGATPPVAVGVILTLNAGDSVRFLAVGLSSGKAVAIGSGSVEGLELGMHAQVDITVTPASASRCFDGILDVSETDVDCGGSDCPACLFGQVCIVPSDCADSTCTFSNVGRCN